MNNLVYIAGGGALGAVLRYGMTTGVHTLFGRDFPYGTLSVNVLGSILIGFLYILIGERMDTNVAWRLTLIVGVLGSFTTFSAFSLETFNLIQDGQPGKAALNVMLSVCLCVLGCWLGITAGKKII